jgi:uncharacterized protein
MQVNIESDITSYTIRAYQPGEITLTVPYSANNNRPQMPGEQAPRPLAMETVSGSFVLSPKHLLRDWAPISIETLQAEHLDLIIELQPELVLLGTGTRLTFPAPQLLASLHRQRIGVEVMDTAAACRTYNILMGEGRFVVAGLINPAED